MTIWVYFLALLVPMAVVSLIVPRVRNLCLARGLLDHPGGRKTHSEPVPRLGGIAIFVAFTGTVGVGFVVAPWLASMESLRELFPPVMTALAEAWRVKTPLLGLLAGGTLVFAVGLVDDLFGDRFPTHWKFAGQCVAAGMAVACGIRVDFLGNVWCNSVVSFLWILGISNSFNLLDNMDGLAAGVATASAAIFLINAAELGEIFICLVLTALIGSLVGFLRFNLHPASLFMGDCGALFLGFTISSLTILENYVSPASSSLFPVLMPPLVLAVPLLDTSSVIFIRLREGRPIHVGDRCHLSHRLVRCGLSEPQAVVFLLMVTFGLGLGALHLADASPARSLWILVDSALLATLVLWGIRFGTAIETEQAAAEATTRKSSKAAEGI